MQKTSLLDGGCGRYRGPDRRDPAPAALPRVPLPAVRDPFSVAALLITVLAVVGVVATAGRRDAVPLVAVDPRTVAGLCEVGGAVLAAVAGVVAVLCARLTGGAALAYLGTAALLTSAALVPYAILPAPAPPGPIGAGSVAITMTAGVLAALATRTPEVDSRPGSWWTAGWVAGALTVAVALVDGLRALSPAGLQRLAAATLAVAGLSTVVRGLCGHRPVFWRSGVGLAVLAAGTGMGAGLPSLDGNRPAVAAVLRLVGTALLVVAVVPELAGGLRTRHRREETIRDRWWAAESAARHARDLTAEHDHEIRNALLGIAGATEVLVRRADPLVPGEREALTVAVRTELARLQDLVSPRAGGPGGVAAEVGTRPDRSGTRRTPPTGAAGFDLAAVVRPLLAAARAGGVDVRVSIPAGLVVPGRGAALAQIVVNLLANCARYAPGGRVTVAAERRGGRVVLAVSDDGPGRRPGTDTADGTDTGTGPRHGTSAGPRHGAGAGGEGRGLRVCARLARELAGTVRVVRPAGGGWVVVVDLPVTGT